MRVLRTMAFLLAVLLAACSELPTSGPVVEVSVNSQGRGVQIAPEPPAEGMAPARVVEGFLQAMSDPTGGYSVARQYLTAEAAEGWEPDLATVIYDGALSEVDGNQILEGTTQGILDQEGRFTVERLPLIHDFQIVDEDGEWRIGAAPRGILLSRYIFERSYALVKSYFVARQGQSVIADVLHIPTVSLTPERVLRAQFAGPSKRTALITRSAIPDGVQLGPGGATIDAEGTVLVDLTGLPAELPDQARRELGAQLLWSLASIPRVTGLRVTSDGAPWVIPGQNARRVLELSSQQGYQPLSRASAVDLFGVRETRLGRLSPEQNFIPLNGDGQPLDMAAVSLDGATTAYVSSETGVVRIGPAAGTLSTVDSTVRQARAAQFAAGRLWLLGVDATGVQRLVTLSAQGEVVEVGLQDLPGAVVDFAVDPSGTRVGVIVDVAGARQFGLAMVDETPRFVSFEELRPVTESRAALSDAGSLDWTSEIDLALIGRSGAGMSVFIVRSDGSSVTDIGPSHGEEPVQLTALPRPGGDSVAVRHAGGDVLVYSAHRAWQRANAAFDWISYPG